jgi:hypothetical protein
MFRSNVLWEGVLAIGDHAVTFKVVMYLLYLLLKTWCCKYVQDGPLCCQT